MLEWIKCRFWGLVVKDHIKIFNDVWDILNKHGNIGQRNCYTYGDRDVGVWIEKVKNSKNKKVIVSTRYCSAAAADNTHLYILLESSYIVRFLCRTVWPRQNKKGGYKVVKSKRHPDGWFSWNDDRDIKFPSIKTYRDRDFKFGYEDCRDKGSVFAYEDIGDDPQVGNAHWSELKIPSALEYLRWHLGKLKDYELNRCK